MSQPLTAGARAPELDLAAAGGGRAVLVPGRRTIVYFFPKAGTSGCTAQACEVQDSLEGLTADGYEVVGVSPDPVAALEDFAAEHRLAFTLASDPGATTAQAWGAWGEKIKDGRAVTGLVRSTVVVGPDGTVVDAAYGVEPVGHVAALRERLGLV